MYLQIFLRKELFFSKFFSVSSRTTTSGSVTSGSVGSDGSGSVVPLSTTLMDISETRICAPAPYSFTYIVPAGISKLYSV